MENKEKMVAMLFGDNPNISVKEKFRVVNELQKIGSLTFTVSMDEGGWMAQCNEVSGIIAGGNNPTPSNSEIESGIRDSILSTFDVQEDAEPISEHDGFSYSFQKTSGSYQLA